MGVVMWSIGNEIPDRFSEWGVQMCSSMSKEVHRLDPGSGRPVTSAYPLIHEQDSQFLHNLDVAGYNYADADIYSLDHSKLPERIIVGTESWPTQSFQLWSNIDNMSWVIGDFIWTALDYIGETAIGSSSVQTRDIYSKHPFPWHVSNCGDIDLCGHQKPQGVYRTGLWNVSEIGLVVHHPDTCAEKVSAWGWPDESESWTWPGFEGTLMQLRIFARGCDSAQVLLDNKIVGTALFHENLTAVLNVEYQPGQLEAQCLVGDDVRTSTILATADTPTALTLEVDHSDIWHDARDLAYVTVAAVDANGTLAPQESVDVTFTLSGPGRLIAVGSGNPASPESYQQPHRRTWRGRVVAIIQPDPAQDAGLITLMASASGLPSVSAVVRTRAGKKHTHTYSRMLI